MAVMIDEFARSGLVNIVGGCCGTKPDHIKAFGEAIAGVVPRQFRKSRNICGCRGWSRSH